MILKRRFDFDLFYTVYGENPDGNEVPLTYGNLKNMTNQEYVNKFKEMFKKYLYIANSDNSLITLTVSDNELDDVKVRISKFGL